MKKMDKNTYETYEFQSTETDASQFFVVQDDGTFLLNRPVQYVAQVEDVKESLQDVQPCTVYDVSSQQFYVDVDNSTELISVSDQFILPESENGLYNNSYLLQPTSSGTLEETKMDEDVTEDQYKIQDTQDVDVDAVTYNSKQSNNFTEITLSDEQYKMLEQKGWILLESFNKIFVLNTLGLHDITTNEKLIQKLKNELQNTSPEDESGCIKTENIQSQLPNIIAQPLTNQQEAVEFVDRKCDEQDENSTMESYEFVVDEEDITEGKVEKLKIEEPKMEVESIKKAPRPEIVLCKPQNNAKSMRIKTKLTFKDIPDNIFLGKSVNGKRIVAKVTHRELPSKAKAKVNEDIPQDQQYDVAGLGEAQFVNLVQQSVRGRLQGMTTTEDIAFADNIVSQLMKVPNMNVALVDQNLLITKTASNTNEYGMLSPVKLVTGRLVFKDNEYAFEHMPNLLQNITKTRSDDPIASQRFGDDSEESNNINVFHIHVSESISSDNTARISVTLNKRQLSLNLVHDIKRRYPYTIFACGACATTFKNEEALNNHQKDQCLQADKKPTTDIENEDTGPKKHFSIIRDRKRNEFICALCDAKFKSIRNCQRHINTHVGPKQSITDSNPSVNEEDSTKKSNKVYKCKMCSSMYFHPATLSKHIVARHINVKSNQ